MKKVKIILGTVQMGLSYGINNFKGQIDTNESFAILSRARELGVTTLDTAESYGTAHKLIGAFHEKTDDFFFKINTKFPSNLQLDNIESTLHQYLEDLKVENIETIMFHSFSSYIANKHKLEELLVFKKNKIVNYIGASIYTNDEFEQIINDEYIDVVQIPFNLFDNWNLRGKLIIEAKKKGKVVHVRSAFLQGLFFININNKNKIVQNLREELLLIQNIANSNGMLVSELALNYPYNIEEIDGVLIGVDSEMQLVENIQSITKINSHITKQIDEIYIKNTDLLNPSLWK